jgi:hypothetical protein
VDAVIMGSGCTDVPQGLKALANALARKNMAKNMQVGGWAAGGWRRRGCCEGFWPAVAHAASIAAGHPSF